MLLLRELSGILIRCTTRCIINYTHSKYEKRLRAGEAFRKIPSRFDRRTCNTRLNGYERIYEGSGQRNPAKFDTCQILAIHFVSFPFFFFCFLFLVLFDLLLYPDQ